MPLRSELAPCVELLLPEAAAGGNWNPIPPVQRQFSQPTLQQIRKVLAVVLDSNDH